MLFINVDGHHVPFDAASTELHRSASSKHRLSVVATSDSLVYLSSWRVRLSVMRHRYGLTVAAYQATFVYDYSRRAYPVVFRQNPPTLRIFWNHSQQHWQYHIHTVWLCTLLTIPQLQHAGAFMVFVTWFGQASFFLSENSSRHSTIFEKVHLHSHTLAVSYVRSSCSFLISHAPPCFVLTSSTAQCALSPVSIKTSLPLRRVTINPSEALATCMNLVAFRA